MFACPKTRAPLQEWYSQAADTLYPVLDGIPVLVPDPHRFLMRHGPWDPGYGAAGEARVTLGVAEADAVTPFLPPSRLPLRPLLTEVMHTLGDRDPDSVCAAWAAERAMSGPAVDWGCGVGTMSYKMARLGREVYALDRSLEAVSLARALLTGGIDELWVPTHRGGAEATRPPISVVNTPAHFAVADVRHPPLAARHFTWVHLGMILDGLSADDQVDALSGAVEALAPGGLLTITTAYDTGPALPAQPRPEPELAEALTALGLSLMAEEDDVPRVRRRFDRAVEITLVHCTAWRKAAGTPTRRA